MFRITVAPPDRQKMDIIKKEKLVEVNPEWDDKEKRIGQQGVGSEHNRVLIGSSKIKNEYRMLEC